MIHKQKALTLCETEKELTELKGLMTFFDASPDCIGIISNDSILYCNEAMVRQMAAPSLNTLLELSPHVFAGPQSRESIKWRINALQTQEKKALEPMHRHLIRLDGSNFEAIIYARALNEINLPHLIVLTVNDLTESREREALLAESSARFNEITEQSLALMERERHLLSQEIHDDFGQFFVAMSLRLSWLKNQMDNDKLAEVVSELETMSKTKSKQARQMAMQLRPPQLDEVDIEQACRDLFQLCLRDTSIKWSVSVSGNLLAISSKAQTVAFRIIQEAVSNLLKYANASEVNLSISNENDKVVVNLSDNGCGFNANQATIGMGLGNMRDRAEFFGGEVIIESEPNSGTSISITLPLE